ncbi:MAG: type 4a pilus biogenesis protein PilO [Candidatus Pacebacteria bacterium]|nr:type 4a pilus biogenesis protein PilO [Candidatus Paceibacterota bacterium]MBP9840211.1 type 4a pilus biogenesis protein PilO [Candidatus Paceibacterota bacterium]
MMSRLVPFALILIAIGLFFGYVKPTWQGPIRILEEDIATFDRTLEAAEDFQKKLSELDAQSKQIPQQSLDRLGVFLPNGADNISLILDLTELAERTNMEITTFDTPEPAAKGDSSDTDLGSSSTYESLEMTLTAQGTYTDFRVFLDAVERSLRPLDVVGITVANSETGVYEYQIVVRFYWLAQAS